MDRPFQYLRVGGTLTVQIRGVGDGVRREVRGVANGVRREVEI